MKLLCLFLLVPSFVFSQLDIKEKSEPKEIGEINYGGVFVMSLTHLEDLEYYNLMFKNVQYQSITDIKSFSFKEDDFESLYNAINDGLTNREKKELEVKLDNGDILTIVLKGKIVTFQLWNGTSISSSSPINQKQLNKLFGKAT